MLIFIALKIRRKKVNIITMKIKSNIKIIHTGIPHFIALHRYCGGVFVFFLNKLKFRISPKASLSAPFFQQHVFTVSVSHFGNSCSISNFFVITVSVTVISDLWCYYCNCFGGTTNCTHIRQ